MREIHPLDCCCSRCSHPATSLHRRKEPLRFTYEDFVAVAIVAFVLVLLFAQLN
jgi:hypothetical protein